MPINAFADNEQDLTGWCEETGRPGVMLFANAVQVWSIAQDRDVTVLEAALAFNVAPNLIEQAILQHPWMLIGPGGVIERDGE